MTLLDAMVSLRDVLVAVLSALMRGPSLLGSLLTFWSGASVSSQDGAAPFKSGADPAADFLADAERLFLAHIGAGGLRQLSQRLKSQFKERLRSNPDCMLPSYNSQLPTGRESGRFLALDVGGSTLRVALVELRASSPSSSVPESRIIRMDSFKIDAQVRSLRGTAFFDWMAERIRQTLSDDDVEGRDPEHPLLVGLAWSFPIEQTSSRGGNICAMGKGFLANEGLLGQDLGEVIQSACLRKGVHVQLGAIVNDSSAALLSEAYTTPSTRFSLILGTGVNIAAHLPVATIDSHKFGSRPESWFEQASHVIVNTELGMFGHGILPLTKWDERLKKAHPRPEFQPLEHLVSGYYLGEICRLVLLDAIPETGILGGVIPPSLEAPYSLDTETLSIITGDTTTTLTTSITTFKTRHPSPTHTPTTDDMRFLRALAQLIARRSAAIIAASLVALWELKAEAERGLIAADLASSASSPASSSSEGEGVTGTGTGRMTRLQRRQLQQQQQQQTTQIGGAGASRAARFAAAASPELSLARHGTTTVAYNGSVIENFPGYRGWVQGFVDGLVAEAEGDESLGDQKTEESGDDDDDDDDGWEEDGNILGDKDGDGRSSSGGKGEDGKEGKSRVEDGEVIHDSGVPTSRKTKRRKRKRKRIELVEARESSLRGAAVGLACLLDTN